MSPLSPVKRQRRRKKQRKIPKSLYVNGAPIVSTYGSTLYDFMQGDTAIPPQVVSDSASSSLHDKTPSPRDTPNLPVASSSSSPANQLEHLVVSESPPLSVQDSVMTPEDPGAANFASGSSFDFNGQGEDTSPLTNNSSNSTGSFRLYQLYQQWPDPALNQYIPTSIDLDGVPVYIYAAPVHDFLHGNVTIQPFVVSESVFSSLHHTTPSQDRANLAFSSPANQPFVETSLTVQVSVTTPQLKDSGTANIPSFDFSGQGEDIFPLTNTYSGQYGPSCPSNSPCSFSVDSEQQWQDLLNQCFNPQPMPSHVSNTSSSSTGSFNLNMEYDVEPYEQCPDLLNQYSKPEAQPMPSQVLNASTSSTGSFSTEHECLWSDSDPNNQYI